MRAGLESTRRGDVMQGLKRTACTLVFTDGIRENAAPIRDRICRAANWLGLELDEKANAAGGPRISHAESIVSAWVIPTDEELISPGTRKNGISKIELNFGITFHNNRRNTR